MIKIRIPELLTSILLNSQDVFNSEEATLFTPEYQELTAARLLPQELTAARVDGSKS